MQLIMASILNFAVALLALVAILGVEHAHGQTLFSTLPKTLSVKATMPNGSNITDVHTGKDSILVSWSANATAVAGGKDANYRMVQTKLCFAKASQTLRSWRQTNDNLKKDKTCLYAIAKQPYTAAGASFTYKVPTSIPGAMYFVRAYALDGNGTTVAFGQTSDKNRTLNTFTVIPISGRHASIDVAVGVLSAFSVGSLFTFFIVENIYLKRKKAV